MASSHKTVLKMTFLNWKHLKPNAESLPVPFGFQTSITRNNTPIEANTARNSESSWISPCSSPCQPNSYRPDLCSKYMSSTSASCHFPGNTLVPSPIPLPLITALFSELTSPHPSHPCTPFLHLAAKQLSRNANLILYRTLRSHTQPNKQNGPLLNYLNCPQPCSSHYWTVFCSFYEPQVLLLQPLVYLEGSQCSVL